MTKMLCSCNNQSIKSFVYCEVDSESEDWFDVVKCWWDFDQS